MSEIGGHLRTDAGRLAAAQTSGQAMKPGNFAATAIEREVALARLQLLAVELAPVFDDVPLDDRQWDFSITSDEWPRLRIDAVTNIVMADDIRSYQFVADSRAGCMILEESTDINAIAYAVTAYIAENLIERMRLIEGRQTAVNSTPDRTKRLSGGSRSTHAQCDHPTDRPNIFLSTLWFVMGALIACGLLYLWFGDRIKLLLSQYS